jgi:adenine deaminase
MKSYRNTIAFLCLILAPFATVMAQDAKPQQSVLITNANIFDGKSDKLATGMSVLVEGNKIAKIAKSITAPAGATVIDAVGRTMTPGFIDMHAHIMFQACPPSRCQILALGGPHWRWTGR